jgi:GxxExxY protein
VHAGLPAGLQAGVYREALGVELTRCAVPVSAGVKVPIHYKGIRLAAHYHVDFVCGGAVLILVRPAGGRVGEASWIQGCLDASGAIRAVVLEFGGPVLGWRVMTRACRPRLVAEGPA